MKQGKLLPRGSTAKGRLHCHACSIFLRAYVGYDCGRPVAENVYDIILRFVVALKMLGFTKSEKNKLPITVRCFRI
jgi:hypothetical protein